MAPGLITGLKYFLLGVVVLYVLSYCIIPFSDGDPACYVLLGRGLFRDYVLPYSYAFDHKPLGVYLFYGLWDRLTPIAVGKFTLLALLLSAVFVSIGRVFGSFSRRLAFVILIICGAIFDLLSGNTELVLVVSEALILALMLKGTETGKIVPFFVAGLIAALVINVNYLAVVCLLGPVALLLFSPGWFRLSRCVVVVFGGIVGLVALFSPYLIVGHGALQAYFSMQRNFLHNYGGVLSDRLLNVFWMTFYLGLTLPILLAWLRRFPFHLADAESRKTMILPVWFASSFPATLLSGHPYQHYFILCFAPATLMLAILFRERAFPSRLALMPLWVSALFFMGTEIRRNVNISIYTSRVDYARIAREVGQARVLNIRAFHAVFYQSDLRPFDVYLFDNHIDILFRQDAWKRYMQDLEQRPAYVVTPYIGCERHEVEAPVCQWLHDHYTLIYTANVRHHNRNSPNKFSLSLYKLQGLPEQPAVVPPAGL
ncbi:hypothetical protein AA0473_0816 [Acetobacter orleanensis NRIC 0473]|uniref:Glycosyltransferase RgtA/B/C/D-like domain-containing protein n=2 Tax=Acetobacter orleanensis TaxID=104099 RepID=A0A4Y3THN4_9PROT|nr:hypothetical protein AD949_11730 [Acetobacter orleanensis]GAN67649.1 hypothetical protein Abol_009_095 [Acetobacter orleanensis JCM 7639]GBR25129.1 hypothetical protein AA0473_0816 [Acetobacter orleanensis NRIC 0473]GEB82491.1 hypothetical protein AOR01nite_09680 [Acetobacter orleanensis]